MERTSAVFSALSKLLDLLLNLNLENFIADLLSANSRAFWKSAFASSGQPKLTLAFPRLL